MDYNSIFNTIKKKKISRSYSNVGGCTHVNTTTNNGQVQRSFHVVLSEEFSQLVNIA